MPSIWCCKCFKMNGVEKDLPQAGRLWANHFTSGRSRLPTRVSRLTLTPSRNLRKNPTAVLAEQCPISALMLSLSVPNDFNDSRRKRNLAGERRNPRLGRKWHRVCRSDTHLPLHCQAQILPARGVSGRRCPSVPKFLFPTKIRTLRNYLIPILNSGNRSSALMALGQVTLAKRRPMTALKVDYGQFSVGKAG
jgi:hypothetical protein